MGISSTKRQGSGTVEFSGGWKFFYSSVDAAMSAYAGFDLPVSPNIQQLSVSLTGLYQEEGFVF